MLFDVANGIKAFIVEYRTTGETNVSMLTEPFIDLVSALLSNHNSLT